MASERFADLDHVTHDDQHRASKQGEVLGRIHPVGGTTCVLDGQQQQAEAGLQVEVADFV